MTSLSKPSGQLLRGGTRRRERRRRRRRETNHTSSKGEETRMTEMRGGRGKAQCADACRGDAAGLVRHRSGCSLRNCFGRGKCGARNLENGIATRKKAEKKEKKERTRGGGGEQTCRMSQRDKRIGAYQKERIALLGRMGKGNECYVGMFDLGVLNW